MTMIRNKYIQLIGKAVNAGTHQFLIRIYREISGCMITQFGKTTNLQGTSCEQFRGIFQPKLLKAFLTPSGTHENVKKGFSIGFFIWDTKEKELFTRFEADVYNNKKENLYGTKTLVSPDGRLILSRWLRKHKDEQNEAVGMMNDGGNDFGHQNFVYIKHSIKDTSHSIAITSANLVPCCVYFAVRMAIKQDWMNDKDQFFAPSEEWKEDREFIADCLAFTLFHDQCNISAREGINYWIPFKEKDIKPGDNFESGFMTDFIKDFVFSSEAKKVFEAGKAMYVHYHREKREDTDYMKDASLRDIRNAMQGRNPNGVRNANGGTPEYKLIDETLRAAVQKLAEKIEPKIYGYGFLLEERTV